MMLQCVCICRCSCESGGNLCEAFHSVRQTRCQVFPWRTLECSRFPVSVTSKCVWYINALNCLKKVPVVKGKRTGAQCTVDPSGGEKCGVSAAFCGRHTPELEWAVTLREAELKEMLKGTVVWGWQPRFDTEDYDMTVWLNFKKGYTFLMIENSAEVKREP